jgi:hypothetical protein
MLKNIEVQIFGAEAFLDRPIARPRVGVRLTPE